jgi:hypothetical protein
MKRANQRQIHGSHGGRPSSQLACERLEPRQMLSALSYSTFLGASSNDQAFAVAADAQGNSYVVGSTSSENFPTTAGALDRSLDGTTDAFLAKFRRDGTFQWATYLGGSGNERAHGVAVDTAGNAYVTGRTDSADFPTTAGSFDQMFNGNVDAFVVKVAAGGELVYSTYLGGSGFELDEGFDSLARRVGAIAVDSAGNAFVTGSTTSDNFPATAGAFRVAKSGFTDVFVTKLNAVGSALVYSTYLGGSDHDRGHGIAVDEHGNAYVTGEAVSRDFPTTANSFQPAHAGGFSDAFVTKLNAAGSALVYSSYLGGTTSEFPGRLTLDSSGHAYVTGTTSSFDFPTTDGALQRAKASNGFDAYVSKVDATGSSLVYSTYLGGSFGNDYGEGIAVDASGEAYVSGHAVSAAFPVADAFQPQRLGPSDAFISKLNASGSALVYSSYLGGGRDDVGYGVAVDPSGTAHVNGWTNSSGAFARAPFATTANAFQPSFGGGADDAFLVKIHGSSTAPPELPSISITDVSLTEGQRGLKRRVFTVSLSSASNLPVTVAFATADGTATASGDDYEPRTGRLRFAPGQTRRSIVIFVNGDRSLESDETFFVNLTRPRNATLADSQGTATIRNDEGVAAAHSEAFPWPARFRWRDQAFAAWPRRL